MYKHPTIDRDKMTPAEGLQILKEGNQRFVNNLRENKDYPSLLEKTKNQQHPFVSILSCSDSRAPVELIFDQAIGDIFSVRLAGNIASKDAIGSLEFGIKYLKRRTSVKSRGAPSIASDPQVFQIPLLSHETWITSFYLFARSQYVLEINEFQVKI